MSSCNTNRISYHQKGALLYVFERFGACENMKKNYANTFGMETSIWDAKVLVKAIRQELVSIYWKEFRHVHLPPEAATYLS